MMTRRELNAALGAGIATLFASSASVSRAESATHQQDSHENQESHENMAANLPRGVTPLLTESIGDLGDSVASMSILTLQPKHVTAPHKHRGPVFAYVLEGRVENQVEPEEPKTYSAGDFWYEPAMHEHHLFTNLSDTDRARVLVFLILPKSGSPIPPAK